LGSHFRWPQRLAFVMQLPPLTCGTAAQTIEGVIAIL
jgi:hypothetical protein